MHYEAKSFSVPELDGISAKTIEEHLGLYAGYVKHVNLINDQIAVLRAQEGDNTYAIAEMQRRLGFEFGGMRNHEYYFAQFEDGSAALKDGACKDMIVKQFGSVDALVMLMKQVALTRGVGWAMLYIDRASDQLVLTWVDEQHIGQLADLDIVLGLDMWEHSYMLDYPPSKKKEYIEAFFRNLNWDVVASRI